MLFDSVLTLIGLGCRAQRIQGYDKLRQLETYSTRQNYSHEKDLRYVRRWKLNIVSRLMTIMWKKV